MDGAFVNQGDHFIAQPRCERTNSKLAPPLRSRGGYQCASVTNDVIQSIKYCCTLDKHFAIIQHQCGHSH